MKEKIVWILIGVMAVAFVYLNVQRAVTPHPNPLPQGERGIELTEVADQIPSPLMGEGEGEGAPRMRVGSATVVIEIADTDAKRAQGLSGRESLAQDQGLLFIMKEPAVHYFWMKDMLFPLDIIWIREGIVVDISENVPAPKDGEKPMTVSPGEPADQVLEVNAGFAEKNGITTGDKVELLTM